MVVKASRPLAHQALIAAGTVGEGAPGHGAGKPRCLRMGDVVPQGWLQRTVGRGWLGSQHRLQGSPEAGLIQSLSTGRLRGL